MTTVENHSHPAPRQDDLYDPEDVGLRSPQLTPMKPNLRPSPEPIVRLPSISLESSPEAEDRKTSKRPKRGHRPSPGDAALIAMMAGGKHGDVSRAAGDNPLASDNEEAEEPMKGTIVGVGVVEKKGGEDRGPVAGVPRPVEKDIEKESLAALAAGAFGILSKTELASPDSAQKGAMSVKEVPEDPMEDVKPTIPTIPPIKPVPLHVDIAVASPEMALKHEMLISPTEEQLPPMRKRSPTSGISNGNSAHQITLPSISESIGDISHLPHTAQPGDSSFPQSPPGRPPTRFNPVPHGHGSPPKSPNDTIRRVELPSPRSSFFFNPHRRPSQIDGPQFASPTDHNSSSTETPSTDQSGATPTAIAIDRMSIDRITNPQVGGFQCTFQGCTAAPFQTQYLLNSHANVHSSNRPHYCNVKGCPRAEGGKGFKRKNEMIRHGLVHDSPGYVCPFCPDREHKYPRPDNLQRHVRVHHVDKDKDDPLLREVLSQRPEGPSRGRRRRGGTA